MKHRHEPNHTFSLTHQEILRYSRHLLMPEVGLEGQAKLKTASALVVGIGGLGSSSAMYLAAAGVGRLGLVDYEEVELSNLQRQVLYGTQSVGERKVPTGKKRLQEINPEIRIDLYDQPLTSENALQIAEPYQIIIDGTDNFPTRYLLNDLCVLTGKPYVYASVFRFEAQLSVFWAKRGPCYRCLLAEPPPPGQIPSCAEAGVFGVLPGTIGTLQATETLKLLLEIGEPLIGKLLLFDALTMRFEVFQLKKNPACKICSPDPEITHLMDYEAFCGMPSYGQDGTRLPTEWEIEPRELFSLLQSGEPLRLIDVREPHETQISNLEGAQLIPLGSIVSEMQALDPTEEIILLCKSGTRSARALELLNRSGFRRVRNLRGGLNAWAEQVDPSQPKY